MFVVTFVTTLGNGGESYIATHVVDSSDVNAVMNCEFVFNDFGGNIGHASLNQTVDSCNVTIGE